MSKKTNAEKLASRYKKTMTALTSFNDREEWGLKIEKKNKYDIVVTHDLGYIFFSLRRKLYSYYPSDDDSIDSKEKYQVALDVVMRKFKLKSPKTEELNKQTAKMYSQRKGYFGRI